MANDLVNIFIKKVTKEARKYLLEKYNKFPRSWRIIIGVIISVGFVSWGVLSIYEKIQNVQLNNASLGEQNVSPVPQTKPTSQEEIIIAQVLGCGTNGDWIPFTDEYWNGLNKGFEKVGNIYTLPKEPRNVDTVAYFKNSCSGSVKSETQFTPRSESLVNLNQYYDGWFRWEIGGNDLRSVKLYKNADGCTRSMKRIVLIDTKKKYFTDTTKIKIDEPVTVTFLAFLNLKGKLRTEIELDFTSATSSAKVHESGFFYEFDIDDSCGSVGSVINPYKDSQEVGVGLQPSASSSAEMPKVEFQQFRIKPYKDEGGENNER